MGQVGEILVRFIRDQIEITMGCVVLSHHINDYNGICAVVCFSNCHKRWTLTAMSVSPYDPQAARNQRTSSTSSACLPCKMLSCKELWGTLQGIKRHYANQVTLKCPKYYWSIFVNTTSNCTLFLWMALTYLKKRILNTWKYC